MPSCKQCGHAFSEGAKFCPECGEKTGKICTQCGASLRPEAIFCGECGSKAVSAAIEDTGKIIAIVDTHPSLPLPSKTVNVSNSHNERKENLK
jgi:uncharacterized OB-fold protein